MNKLCPVCEQKLVGKKNFEWRGKLYCSKVCLAIAGYVDEGGG